MPLLALWFVLVSQCTLLLLEGIGVTFVHTYFVLLSTPALIVTVLLLIHKHKEAHPAVIPSIGWIALLGAVVFSTFGSSMLKHQSLFLSLFYFHLCIFFLLGSVYRNELERILIILLPIVATILALAAFYYRYTGTVLEKGEQLVSATFGSHNHGGELSAIALVLVLCISGNRVVRFILGAILSLSLFLSFSRSAYGIFAIGVLWSIISSWEKYKARSIWITVVVFLMTGMCIVLATKPIPLPQLRGAQSFLHTNLGLQERQILSNRDIYFLQAIAGIARNPLWGSGAGSFIEISRRSSALLDTHTNNAHNMFLEIGVEQGILGMIGLVAIVTPSLLGAIKSKKRYAAVIFLMLFALFQADYTYTIHGVAFLFFLVAGMVTPARKQGDTILMPIAVAFVVLQVVWIDMMIGSTVALGYHNPSLAVKLYPLSVEAHQKALMTLPFVQAQEYVPGYLYASPNTTAYLDVANFYLKNGNRLEAALYYEKAFLSNPAIELRHVLTYVTLLTELHAKPQIVEFRKIFVKTYGSYTLEQIPKEYYPQIQKVCNMVDPACDSIWWYNTIRK